MVLDSVKCRRCGIPVKSFSPMRKWCFDCRKNVTVEQARQRKVKVRSSKSRAV